jgi:hypothetical protein
MALHSRTASQARQRERLPFGAHPWGLLAWNAPEGEEIQIP